MWAERIYRRKRIDLLLLLQGIRFAVAAGGFGGKEASEAFDDFCRQLVPSDDPADETQGQDFSQDPLRRDAKRMVPEQVQREIAARAATAPNPAIVEALKRAAEARAAETSES